MNKKMISRIRQARNVITTILFVIVILLLLTNCSKKFYHPIDVMVHTRECDDSLKREHITDYFRKEHQLTVLGAEFIPEDYGTDTMWIFYTNRRAMLRVADGVMMWENRFYDTIYRCVTVVSHYRL